MKNKILMKRLFGFFNLLWDKNELNKAYSVHYIHIAASYELNYLNEFLSNYNPTMSQKLFYVTLIFKFKHVQFILKTGQ